jgi:hypothetical protein
MPLPADARLTADNSQEIGPPDRKHPEWTENSMRWRRLLDSYEGGDIYRLATYGTDTRGLPIRNLIRHKREYPESRQQNTQTNYGFSERAPSQDPAAVATDDDYQMRLARTPVPGFMAEAIGIHLSAIFDEEVERETANPGIKAWWLDVDGKGTTIDEWMSEIVAPLLLNQGCLDLIFDYPKAPDDETIETQADVMRLGLDRCVASYILPENMVWWSFDDSKMRYKECIVAEYAMHGRFNRRYWTDTDWTLYDDLGRVVAQGDHPFGRPPIVRVFDRKRPRSENVGLPRYESTAENMREYYNRDSELILSDTTQAHPLLQGPEDYIQADGTIPIGPTWLLPKKKNTQGGSATYEGFDVITFPKDGADSIRQNLQLIRDRVDRDNCLTKPAGASGTTGTTVAQSGTSKRLDQSTGNRLLGKISATLQRVERSAVELALLVLGNGTIDQAALIGTEVNYPRSFDLLSPEETAAGLLSFQDALDRAGSCPIAEAELLTRLERQLLPGLPDDKYEAMTEEIEAFLAQRAADREANRQAAIDAGDKTILATEPGTDAPGTSNPDYLPQPDAAGRGAAVEQESPDVQE